MNPALRVVIRIPVEELWREDGLRVKSRLRSLTADDIVALLRSGPVQLVVADVGLPLHWIELAKCHAFWKSELKPALVSPDAPIDLDLHPEGHCYLASEWVASDELPIILCEKYH